MAETRQGGIARRFWWHEAFPLLFFFQFKVRFPVQGPMVVPAPRPDPVS
jgi:hypothetical protein